MHQQASRLGLVLCNLTDWLGAGGGLVVCNSNPQTQRAMYYGNRPLGPLQRNWLNFLRRNPGPHYVAMPQRDLRIAESLQACGLVTLDPVPISVPNGLPVFALEAVEVQP